MHEIDFVFKSYLAPVLSAQMKISFPGLIFAQYKSIKLNYYYLLLTQNTDVYHFFAFQRYSFG